MKNKNSFFILKMNYKTEYNIPSLLDICLEICLNNPKTIPNDFWVYAPECIIKKIDNAKICRCGKYYFKAKYLIISNGTKYPIKDPTAYEDRDFEMKHKIHCFKYDVNKYIRVARQMEFIVKNPDKLFHRFVDC